MLWSHCSVQPERPPCGGLAGHTGPSPCALVSARARYARDVTEPSPPAPGRGLAIASLVLAILGVVVALSVLLAFGGYALFSLTTGAPAHVLASIGHMGAITAAFGVTPIAGLGLPFGLVSLVRSRRSRVRGRGMAITGRGGPGNRGARERAARSSVLGRGSLPQRLLLNW